MPADAPRRGFFDVWSLTYDNPVLQAFTYRPIHDAVVDTLRRQAPRRVLDVGCGTGRLTVRIARELGVDVVGCDYSEGMLGQARGRGGPGLWALGDAMRLPVRTAAVDAVTCTESFHWYPDQPQALREVARVLEPGGRGYLALVSPPLRAVGRVARGWSRRVGQPFSWPTAAELAEMAAGAGLAVVSRRRVLRLPAGPLLPAVLTVLERR